METSLHRQLKALYAGEHEASEQECRKFAGYRIDVVRGDELVEIQHGSLGAIRNKVAKLLEKHPVRVVKPLIARKTLIKMEDVGGREISRRMSPKQCTLLDLFHELIYFTSVFPHPRLTVEVPLVIVEERRIPGHGKRRRWRRNDHIVHDLSMVDVVSTHAFQTNADLLALLPYDLPTVFHTGELADAMGIQRWIAQRITYCLRKTGGMKIMGKQGNALQYELIRELPTKKKRAAPTKKRPRKNSKAS
ncbi:hypothetical protein NA78x_002309 [Anatilimnocola sp. NA78]|uniref:hypothetical protein n=1 Tax=Anatilimnocola sp. NA78 TaxID=3415683 RepID=UPI003CE499C3